MSIHNAWQFLGETESFWDSDWGMAITLALFIVGFCVFCKVLWWFLSSPAVANYFLGPQQKPIEQPEQATPRRKPLTEAVRHEVWRRDQGRCVECGSKENLEFDHIIPISKGGSNTARNIQLLCERCNRSKSDSI